MSEVSQIYYDSLRGMLSRFDERARRDRFRLSGLSDFKSWQERERKVLTGLIGLDRLQEDSGEERYPAGRLEIVGEGCSAEAPRPGSNPVIRYKCLFRVDGYTVMPMYILVPGVEQEDRKKGIWIALAGHQGAGKESVAGVRDIPAISEKIDFFNYDYGLQLAERGYTVICPDPRGFGERRDAAVQGDEPERLLACSCRNVSNMAIPLGFSVIGLCTFDICRLIDHLKRASGGDRDILNSFGADPGDISVIGFSGGGMQALYLSAVRRDISRTVISGYMYGFRDSLLILNNNCSCNYVPGLWEHLDMGDIASLIAPGPLVIQSCGDDRLNGPRGLENVYEQTEIIRRAYGLYGAEERFRHDIRPGGHHFHSECLDMIDDVTL